MRRRGNMALESLLFLPILLLLIVGMVQFARLTYTYYTLKKTLWTAARYITAGQSVNFCDTAGDTTVTNALNMAVSGSTEADTAPQVTGLTTEMLSVTTECVDAEGNVGTCDTSGCDSNAGGPRPSFVTVSIPNGYEFTVRIPYITQESVLLKPYVRIPYGGT